MERRVVLLIEDEDLEPVVVPVEVCRCAFDVVFGPDAAGRRPPRIGRRGRGQCRPPAGAEFGRVQTSVVVDGRRRSSSPRSWAGS